MWCEQRAEGKSMPILMGKSKSLSSWFASRFHVDFIDIEINLKVFRLFQLLSLPLLFSFSGDFFLSLSWPNPEIINSF